MIEIERRWLVASIPEPLPDGERIVQGYLMTTPAGVRVRERAGVFTLTIKTMSGHTDAGLTRTEIERELSAQEFAALWDVAVELRIDKHRYLIEVPGGTAELDLFRGDLDGRRLVEVEFADAAAAAAFVAPAWFGTEVTHDPRFTNASLARHGWPEDT